MAYLKKNQLANIIFPAVDGADFATIESTITASDFDSGMTKKYYGVTHGNSTAFTSGTISKAITLVRSGIFQQTLKAAETNYDYVLYRFAGHPSLADQLLVFQCVDNDDTDIYNLISDVDSQLLLNASMISDIDSQLLLNASMISDIDSQVLLNASVISDVQSALDSQFLIVTSNISDIDSQLTVNFDLISDVDSQLLLNASMISDIDSQLLVTHSLLSDVESAVDLLATSNYLSTVHSDLRSQISGITASVSVSDISDIASAVWAAKYGTHSVASSFGSLFSDVYSRVVLIQSNVSDVDSQLTVNFNLISDVDSQLTVNFDLISDVDSQLLLNASMISDIDSQLTVTHSLLSDVESAVDLLASSNYLSQVHSDLRSQIGGITASVSASDISDIASAVWGVKYADHSLASSFGSLFSDVYSRIVLIQSNVSDVDSQLTVNFNLISDVDSQLLVTHSLLSDVESQVDLLATSNYLSTVHSDLRSQISGLTVNVTASDMSDIASRVWATAEGTRVDSRMLVIQSMVSDVDSQLLLNASVISDIDSQLLLTHSLLSDVESAVDLLASSNYLSQVHSDLRSQIGGITASVSASDISDIASAVWADTVGTRVDSRIRLVQSNVSDVESQLDVTHSLLSDVESQVDLLATSNYLSQVHSDLASAVAGVTASVSASDISDIASSVWAFTTRTLTQGAASVTAAVDGSTITVYRGTTWIVALTGLGDISTYDTIFFSVKEDRVNDSEDNAVLRVYNDASGLERFQKAAPAAATNGTITIDSAVNGDITITIQEAETTNAIVSTELDYDIKGIDDNGNVVLLSIGIDKFNISADVTQAVTSP